MSRVASMRHRRLERTRGRCRTQSPVHPTQRPALCWAFHRTRLRRITRPRPARPHYSPSLPRPALTPPTASSRGAAATAMTKIRGASLTSVSSKKRSAYLRR